MIATLQVEGRTLRIDLDRGHDLSLGPDRQGTGPSHFGAPPADLKAWVRDGFTGAVALGGSCNCSVLTLIPHCHGTHTECAGHLTREPQDAFALLPPGLLPTVLLSVTTVTASRCTESTDPPPQAQDQLVTAHSLQQAYQLTERAKPRIRKPRALVLRTRPNNTGKRQRNYAADPAPYLTREAARWLADLPIEHLIVDLPSIDRAHDAGRMTAHRIFFGLPAHSQALGDAARMHATLTELAYIDDSITDGAGLLSLQASRLPGDAVPSRPLYYPLLATGTAEGRIDE